MSWMTRLTARSTTGVDTGLRPSACSDGAPSSSATPVQREHVDGRGAAPPAERPAGHHAGRVGRHDRRRPGPAGRRPWPPATAAASASSAGAPWAVVVTVIGTAPIVRKGCHGDAAGAAGRESARSAAVAWPGGELGDGVLEAVGVAVQGAAGDEHVGPGARPRRRRCRADAAVDLDVDDVVETGGVDHPAHLGDLRLHRRQVALAAEARVDGHHEHEVDEVEHVGDGARRCRRVERHAGAGARARRSRRACGGGAGTPRRGRSAAGTRPRRSAPPSRRASAPSGGPRTARVDVARGRRR